MHNTGSHLSKDLSDLIKAIGDSRSKQEEDKIILKEVDNLKAKIKEGGTKSKKMKEFLIRAIYIEMLGHEANFTHLHAVNLAQDKNLMNKRVGYLACSLLLPDSSEFLIMLISTLQKDLQTNVMEVCMALITIAKFSNTMIMQAVSEPVIKLLDHSNEMIRKKATLCLIKFYQTNPNMVPEISDKMKKLLCDKDPSVMAASLNYYCDAVRKNPENFKDLVSSFVVILKQIIEHKLPRDYDYHRMPAPWVQVKLLEILAILGRDDQSASENMYEILTQVLRRADDTGINIGYAIVYQCLRTICLIYPNQHLLEQAANTISRFLSSESPNLRCIGINGLGLIIEINPGYVMNHQQVIVDCLEENDETLKKNTFELLYKMTNNENVEVIIQKMMNYLKNTAGESVSKKDILTKITELAERYAIDKGWFIKIMNKLFVDFGELITEEILSKLLKLINEWESETDEQEFQQFTINNYIEIVNTYNILPDALVKLISWVFGEHGRKLFDQDEDKIKNLLRILDYLISKTYDDQRTKFWLISAIIKLSSNINFPKIDFVEATIEKYSKDKNVEIQQRCLEYRRLERSGTKIQHNQFTTTVDEIDIDVNLGFLNNFVSERVKETGKSYRKHDVDSHGAKALNFVPYQAPNIGKEISKDAKNLNKLYESSNYTVNKSALSGDLDLKGVQKKWDVSKGFIAEEPKKTTVYEPSVQPKTISQQRVEGPKLDPKKKEAPEKLTYVPKKEVVDPNREKKEQIKNALFQGIDGGKKKEPAASFTSDKPKPTTSTAKAAVTEVKQPPKQVDLIGLNSDFPVTTTPSTTTTSSQPSTQNINWLADLNTVFSSETSSSNAPVQAQKPASANLLDFELGMSTGPSNTVNTQAGFSNLLNLQKKGLTKQDIAPYKIDTDSFGNYWTECPIDDFQIDIPFSQVTNPQKYVSVVSEFGNFAPCDIINNEVISAGKISNKVVLLHTEIHSQGKLVILVKSYEKSVLEDLSVFLKSIFK